MRLNYVVLLTPALLFWQQVSTFTTPYHHLLPILDSANKRRFSGYWNIGALLKKIRGEIFPSLQY